MRTCIEVAALVIGLAAAPLACGPGERGSAQPLASTAGGRETPSRDAVPAAPHNEGDDLYPDDARMQAIADKEAPELRASAEQLAELREMVAVGVLDEMPRDPDAFVRGEAHVRKLTAEWTARFAKAEWAYDAEGNPNYERVYEEFVRFLYRRDLGREPGLYATKVLNRAKSHCAAYWRGPEGRARAGKERPDALQLYLLIQHHWSQYLSGQIEPLPPR